MSDTVYVSDTDCGVCVRYRMRYVHMCLIQNVVCIQNEVCIYVPDTECGMYMCLIQTGCMCPIQNEVCMHVSDTECGFYICVCYRLVSMCPHTTMYVSAIVSAYYYICVLILIHLSAYYFICVRILLYLSAYHHIRVHNSVRILRKCVHPSMLLSN
jgi:hypothetical protein